MSLFTKKMSAPQALAVSFLGLIALGSVLLALPVSASGQRVPYSDALFTSVSAVCVTGLTVVDTASAYSTFGKAVLLVLIQLGGLGLMTVATAMFALLGKKITLSERLILQESMNSDRMGGLNRLIRWVIVMTLSAEGAGAVLLAARLIPRYGLGQGLFYAVFHSISAFCNAGFSIFPDSDSLCAFVSDPLVNLVIMLLIVTGGLGFAVIADVRRTRRMRDLALQSRIVLFSTLILLALGFFMMLGLEWGNPDTMGKLDPAGRAVASMFQSVTLRTAGFNSVSVSGLTPAVKLLSCAFMFIGAASASTGGGIKVTTFAIVVLDMIRTARGKKDLNLFGRRITRYAVDRSHVIATVALCVLLLSAVALCALSPEQSPLDLLFECASALGTVGLTAVGTANLPASSRIILMLLMYIGRIGPMSAAAIIARRQIHTSDAIKYPAEHVMLG